jgi:peptide/nickel transport system substrate-binding protein
MRRRRTLGGLLTIGSLVVAAFAAPAAAGREPGGAADGSTTLHVLSDLGEVHLDPTAANTPATRSLLSGLVIRSLTQLVYNRPTRQMVLQPDLASTLDHNATYTRWTLTLRKGVRFENGKLVRPIDVKYGIERSFDREAFPSGPRFSNLYFLHGHTYHGPYRSGTDYDGVVIRGQQITLKMARPFPDLPYYLAFPAMSPIPPGRDSNPARYQNHPWATGPYMFRDYAPGHLLRLVKNPYWDPATDPHRAQAVDNVNVRLDMPSIKIDAALMRDTGTARTSVSLTSPLAADFDYFQSHWPHRLAYGSNRCVDMFDPDNRKITDIRVRRALGWAYPYQATWAASGQIPGVYRVPATNLEPPGTSGRISYNPLPGHTPGTTNPVKAKALLKAAHKLHYVIRFAYKVDDPVSVHVKNVLVPALQAAGFHSQPVATFKRDYVHDYLKNPNANINVRAVTRCSPFPTGGSVLVPEFHSTDIDGKGFGNNYSAFSNKPVDDRMREIALMRFGAQPRAWNALDKRIQLRHFPTVVTAYHGVALMRGSDVQGFAVDSTTGMPTWNTLKLRQ